MLYSKTFTKTRKEAPKDEVSKNAKLLIRAGFIDKLSSGVYTYLPLGLRVLRKIETIVRNEMNALGAEELLMPALNPKENWLATGRWESMDDLYKIIDARGKEFALAPTHEEVVVPLVKQFISSYRDLPLFVYQFQSKFRMELRAKSGLLRGREFLMKDLYSFHEDEEDLKRFYKKVEVAYKKIFNTLEIGKETYRTYASGGSFSEYSYEFQTVTEAGEDTIYICSSCDIGINKEIIKNQRECPSCTGEDFKEVRAIEVGNIFELKTKFSDAFDLNFKDKNGKTQKVIMGCYGLGIGRAMGAVVEVMGDKKGVRWPHAIAPFQFHLIEVPSENPDINARAKRLYADLEKAGFEVFYDDRQVSAGIKFSDADLMGIPYILTIGEETVKKGLLVELKNRESGATRGIPESFSPTKWRYPLSM